MKLEPEAIDFAARSRARKARYIIRALEESARTRGPASPATLLAEAKSLTLDGRLLAESRAHQLMGTKKPRAASETTWALVIDELESRADAAEEDKVMP